MSTITETQDAQVAKTDADERQTALDAYVARKKALRARWDAASALRGAEYTAEVGKYSADKARLRKDWDAFVAKYGG